MSDRPTLTPPISHERVEGYERRFCREMTDVIAWIDERTRALQHPDTIVEAVATVTRQCEDCAHGRRCERLERLKADAWEAEE